MGKRTAASVFDAVSALEEQDHAAEAKRQRQRKHDAKQSKAVHDQLQLHRRLVECRILLQRSLAAPTTSSKSTVDDCNEILGLLLNARDKLDDNTQNADDDDEQINSAGENDGRALDTYLSKVSALNLEEVLQEEYESARDSWKKVLNRRHADLQLRTGSLKAKKKNDTKFSVVDASFWQQIESTVEYEAMRQKQNESVSFDDSKLYQHMLHDFVSSSATTGAAPTSRKLKSSSKKKQVDRKASKGRKIRYTEIPKLVSFAFPLSKAKPPSATVMDDDAWFSSLFGG